MSYLDWGDFRLNKREKFYLKFDEKGFCSY